MPNPFPGMKFVPRRPRLGCADAVASYRGQQEPTWDAPPIQGLADLARWFAGAVNLRAHSLDVHPVAIPNPYPSTWADVPFPDGLWLVIHRLTYHPWISLYSVNQVVAVVWRWAPLAAGATLQVLIRDPDGTVLETVNAVASEGPREGVWFLPDSRWDAGLHEVRVTVTASDRSRDGVEVGVVRSPGCLVPAELPTGWDPLTPGVRGEAAWLPARPIYGTAADITASDWTARYRGFINDRAPYSAPSGTMPRPAFPRLWRGGAFAEALNAPFNDDLGPCRVASGIDVLIGAPHGRIDWQRTDDVDTTRGASCYLPPCGLALMFQGAGPDASAAVTIKDWTSGTILYDGVLAAEERYQDPGAPPEVIVLPLADPGLGPDAVWEVSAAIAPTGFDLYGQIFLRVIPLYRPLPFAAMAADGSRVILGGTRAGQRRAVDPRTVIPVLTADPGALTVAGPLEPSTDPLDQVVIRRAAFTPSSAGWYRVSATRGSTSAYARPVEEARWIGTSDVPAAWRGPLPFEAYVYAGARPVEAETLTVTLTRMVPTPAALGATLTALAVPTGWDTAWGAFTAPAAGRYRLTVAFTDRTYHATPDAAAPDAPRCCAYAAVGDPDALAGVRVVYEGHAVNDLVQHPYDTAPPTTLSPATWVVGLAPTGAWTGHAGQLARPHLTAAGAVAWTFTDPPDGLVNRIHDADGVIRLLRYQDGKWQGWRPTIDVDLAAGQVLTVRAHGPRLPQDAGHGGPIAAGDCWAKVEALAPA